MKRFVISFLVSATLITAGVFIGVGAFDAQPLSVETYAGFTESNLSTTGQWFYLPGGEYNMIIFGAFDGSSATVETWVGDESTVFPVAVPKLVGVLENTTFEWISVGAGYYRLNISGGAGSVDLSWHARKVF